MGHFKYKTINTNGESPVKGSISNDVNAIIVKQVSSTNADLYATSKNGKVLQIGKDSLDKSLETLSPEGKEVIKNLINSNLNNYMQTGGSTITGSDIEKYIDNIFTIINSDDGTLNSIQSIVDYIKQNKEVLDTLSISNIAGLERALEGKVDKINGKELSDNNFTTSLKEKLESIDLSNYVEKTLYSTQYKVVTTLISTLSQKLQSNNSDLSDLQSLVDYVITLNTAITNLSNNKVDKISGKNLSSNDFTNELKEKLETLDIDKAKPSIVRNTKGEERKFQDITKSEFDAIAVKDPNTYYYITD